MATMLAVLTTDALLDSAAATDLLRAAVGVSFNCLTVDGAESTNDTVLLLASGAAGPVEAGEFGGLLADACRDLAIQMADDAEGSTRTVFLTVTGAARRHRGSEAGREPHCQLPIGQVLLVRPRPLLGKDRRPDGSSRDRLRSRRPSPSTTAGRSFTPMEPCPAGGQRRVALAAHMAGRRTRPGQSTSARAAGTRRGWSPPISPMPTSTRTCGLREDPWRTTWTRSTPTLAGTPDSGFSPRSSGPVRT